jgi:hypothetical protein
MVGDFLDIIFHYNTYPWLAWEVPEYGGRCRSSFNARVTVLNLISLVSYVVPVLMG